MRAAIVLGCLLAVASCGGGDDDDPIDAGDIPSFDAGSLNEAPVASFTIEPPCTMGPDTEITFTSTSTDPEDDTLTCMWTFSSATNNPPRNVCTVSPVTFPNFSPYPATLVVNDGNGNTDTTTMNVAPCN